MGTTGNRPRKITKSCDIFYQQSQVAHPGNIPASTKPVKGDLKPKKVNLKMEKELKKYKKEIEEKYEKSQMKQFVFKRTVTDIQTNCDFSDAASPKSNVFPKLSNSMQRNIIQNKISNGSLSRVKSDKIFPAFSRTTRFDQLQKFSKAKVEALAAKLSQSNLNYQNKKLFKMKTEQTDAFRTLQPESSFTSQTPKLQKSNSETPSNPPQNRTNPSPARLFRITTKPGSKDRYSEYKVQSNPKFHITPKAYSKHITPRDMSRASEGISIETSNENSLYACTPFSKGFSSATNLTQGSTQLAPIKAKTQRLKVVDLHTNGEGEKAPVYKRSSRYQAVKKLKDYATKNRQGMHQTGRITLMNKFK